MITITMSKKDDLKKLMWCAEFFGPERFKFQEPMQLTFKNKHDRLLYAIEWNE